MSTAEDPTGSPRLSIGIIYALLGKALQVFETPELSTEHSLVVVHGDFVRICTDVWGFRSLWVFVICVEAFFFYLHAPFLVCDALPSSAW